MAHWNYRIVKQRKDGWISYAIHEVYYFDDGISWTENPVGPSVVLEEDMTEGDAISQLKDMLSRMIESCDKPILDKSDE